MPREVIHNLMNLITVITLHLDETNTRLPDNEARASLEQAQRSVEKMLEIIEKL